MGTSVVIVIVLAFFGVLVWQFIETRNALTITSILTRHTPDESALIVESAFGGARSVLWTNDRGPGTLNKRRGYQDGITMSIDIELQPDGRTQVSMWASRHMEYLFGLASMAGVVNRRKRAIARLLTEPASQPPAIPAGQPSYPAADQVADPRYR